MILSNYDYLRSVSDTTSADSKLVPTGRVIGIIKRNWRQYCGILQPSALKDSVRHLFIPAEKKIPRVRIETRQVSMFNRTKLICSYLQEFHDAFWIFANWSRSVDTSTEISDGNSKSCSAVWMFIGNFALFPSFSSPPFFPRQLRYSISGLSSPSTRGRAIPCILWDTLCVNWGPSVTRTPRMKCYFSSMTFRMVSSFDFFGRLTASFGDDILDSPTVTPLWRFFHAEIS